MVYVSEIVSGQSENTGVYAAARAAGELIARGADEFSISVRIAASPCTPQKELYQLAKKVKAACREHKIPLADVEYTKLAGLSQYVVSVAGGGEKMPSEESGKSEGPGGTVAPEDSGKSREIVIAGWIALEGTLRILEEGRETLEERFALGFLHQTELLAPMLFQALKMKDAVGNGCSAMYPAGDGGIFAALWKLSEESGAGFEADLKKFPIRQETVELCEYFRLNPYQLASCGCALMLTPCGEDLVAALRRAGIPAEVIGRMREDRDKRIINGDETRYLDRPAPDEINKIYEMEVAYGRN